MNKIWRKTSIVLLAVSMLFLISMFATVQARPILDLDGEFYFPIRYCGCADDPFILVIVKYENGTYVHKARIEIYNSAGTLLRTGYTWYGLYLTWFRNHDTYTIKAFKDGLSAETTLTTTKWFHCVSLTLKPSCYEVTIHVQGYSGPMTDLRIYIVDTDLKPIAGPQVPDSNGDTTFSLASGTYKAKAVPVVGEAKFSESFTVPGATTVTITF